MNIESLSTIESIENFLQGNQAIAYSVLGGKTERYQFIRKTLVKFSYATCSKKHKGVINAFLRKISGYSRQQLTRLVRQHETPCGQAVKKLCERRKPKPNGQPGYIRIDTVHQGDQDKQKGVYHINAVDELTQFEVICSVEKISETFLIPIIKQLLDKFPFKIINFHSDNGSEYINQHVAKLLKKLLIEFTKSRSRQTNESLPRETLWV